jgi:hypothetical protein
VRERRGDGTGWGLGIAGGGRGKRMDAKFCKRAGFWPLRGFSWLLSRARAPKPPCGALGGPEAPLRGLRGPRSPLAGPSRAPKQALRLTARRTAGVVHRWRGAPAHRAAPLAHYALRRVAPCSVVNRRRGELLARCTYGAPCHQQGCKVLPLTASAAP